MLDILFITVYTALLYYNFFYMLKYLLFTILILKFNNSFAEESQIKIPTSEKPVRSYIVNAPVKNFGLFIGIGKSSEKGHETTSTETRYSTFLTDFVKEEEKNLKQELNQEFVEIGYKTKGNPIFVALSASVFGKQKEKNEQITGPFTSTVYGDQTFTFSRSYDIKLSLGIQIAENLSIYGIGGLSVLKYKYQSYISVHEHNDIELEDTITQPFYGVGAELTLLGNMVIFGEYIKMKSEKIHLADAYFYSKIKEEFYYKPSDESLKIGLRMYF